MNNIEQFIEMCILKNTGKLVKNAIPAKDIISNTTVDSFTIRQISQAIYEVINA